MNLAEHRIAQFSILGLLIPFGDRFRIIEFIRFELIYGSLFYAHDEEDLENKLQ